MLHGNSYNTKHEVKSLSSEFSCPTRCPDKLEVIGIEDSSSMLLPLSLCENMFP